MATTRIDPELRRIAERGCALARRRGAQAAAATVRRTQSIKVVVRDGQLEELKAAETRSLVLRLFVDGRYGSHQTSSLGAAPLERFIGDAVELTRLLEKDPLRSLPDPGLWRGRSQADLALVDPARERVTMAERKARALALESAARAATGRGLISIGSGCSDDLSDEVLVTSAGFADGERATGFYQWLTVSVRDPSGKRPDDWVEDSARTLAGLEPPRAVAERCARRALAQIGVDKIASCRLPLIVENRAVSRLLSGLLSPLDGRALDQKQSCLEGQLGARIGSELLSIVDEPLRPGGWGSARFDWEGLALRRRPLFEGGVLRDYTVDSYYAKKLGRAPTSSQLTNLVFGPGSHDLDAMCADAGRAVLVSDFIGGNPNPTTGDFSLGLRGFLVEGGRRARPLGSLNVAGNHREFWKQLRVVGNDPYPHSSQLTPSLLFDGVAIAGK